MSAWYCLMIVSGMVIALLGIKVLNCMPAKCFCDYDETPDEHHMAPRASVKKQGWMLGLFLSLVYILLWKRYGITLQLVALMLMIATMCLISLADFRFSIIPDELILVAGMFAVISVIPSVIKGTAFIDKIAPLAGALIGAGIIVLLNLLGRLLYHKEAMGMGDLKLMTVSGLACGYAGIWVVFLLAVLFAGLFFIVAIGLKKLKADQYYPMGPYLVLGTIVVSCCYPYIQSFINWYISLL